MKLFVILLNKLAVLLFMNIKITGSLTLTSKFPTINVLQVKCCTVRIS